jgi:predicted nucleic acid-binding protein
MRMYLLDNNVVSELRRPQLHSAVRAGLVRGEASCVG